MSQDGNCRGCGRPWLEIWASRAAGSLVLEALEMIDDAEQEITETKETITCDKCDFKTDDLDKAISHAWANKTHGVRSSKWHKDGGAFRVV